MRLSNATFEPVRKRRVVALAPERAFELFTRSMASWWPLRTHSIGEERAADIRFEQLENDTNQEIARPVEEVNEITRELAGINRQIRDREFGANGSSELRDRRNVLLEQLGERIDFTSFELPASRSAAIIIWARICPPKITSRPSGDTPGCRTE